MCGIVGFAKQDCLKDLYEGLRTLEYRGYDSSGVAYLDGSRLVVRKRKGRVERLRAFLFAHHADVAMGHTRWATHGAPSNVNAHPHRAGRFAVVHNGIISNYASLRDELSAAGRRFLSGTDTEVIAHLLDVYMQGDVVEAIHRTIGRLEGNWAVAALYEGTPDRVYLFKKGNPLIVGRGDDFYCFASDTPALVRYTQTIYKMADDEIACIRRHGARFWRGTAPFEPNFWRTTLCAQEVEKGNYPTFMAKEMAEIPRAITDTWRFLSVTAPPDVSHAARIFFTGCGTAYHACLYAASCAVGVPTRAVVASEFDPATLHLGPNDVVVAVSQSGETADTLSAVQRAKGAGAGVIGITNVPQSGLTTAVDGCLVTKAGAEIAVAATKSYSTQLLALRYLLSPMLPLPDIALLSARSGLVYSTLNHIDAVSTHRFSNVFLLAKGADYVTCLEGALKIKELAYLPCDTCYAGEIKHGPLACVTAKTLVVAVCTEDEGVDKMRTALHEVATRGARCLAIGSSPHFLAEAHWAFRLPEGPDMAPFLAVQPLQYLAYRLALAAGRDPDKPRNLAKSVTVE